MKLFKIKKAADTTIRQVRTDDKQTVLGIVGVAEDLVSVGLIEQYSGPAGVWIFTSVHGRQHDEDRAKGGVEQMKKVFCFGKIDYFGIGRKINAVTVEVEYSESGGKMRFSACGNVYDNLHTDIVAGGQCLDTIGKHVKTPLFREILRLWNLYHLNDMHPECKHQAALGWREKAREKVNLYHWTMTGAARDEQARIKKDVIDAARACETFTTSPEESFVLSLEHSFTTPVDELPETMAKYYEPKKPLFSGDKGHVEEKLAGWLHEDEHPSGILCKPCPVCGYKYGTSWNHFPIPADDETAIYGILNGVQGGCHE